MTVTYRSNNKFSRDAWLEIDLSAIEHNYQAIKQSILPETKVMAVVKSDAYGHGSEVVCPLLESSAVDYFGVASVDEGIILRNTGIQTPILILSPTPSWSLKRALEHNLEISISSIEQLNQLIELKQNAKIQIFINTGMNREGASPVNAIQLIQAAIDSPSVQLNGVFSHLAFPASHEYSQKQLKTFQEVTSPFERSSLGLLHIGASSAINQSEYHLNMIRPGIALYGHGDISDQFRPALSLQSRLSHIHCLQPGESTGYNQTWTAERESTIGLLPLGYADGIPRNLSNNLDVSYQGEMLPIIGNISMDQIMVDLTNLSNIPSQGEIFSLISSDLTIKNWAEKLDTIDYEILCGLRARLPRIYKRNAL